MVVANDLERINGSTHVAWIIDSARSVVRIESGPQLCDQLTATAAHRLRTKDQSSAAK
jgi:hypothetical protein